MLDEFRVPRPRFVRVGVLVLLLCLVSADTVQPASAAVQPFNPQFLLLTAKHLTT